MVLAPDTLAELPLPPLLLLPLLLLLLLLLLPQALSANAQPATTAKTSRFLMSLLQPFCVDQCPRTENAKPKSARDDNPGALGAQATWSAAHRSLTRLLSKRKPGGMLRACHRYEGGGGHG